MNELETYSIDFPPSLYDGGSLELLDKALALPLDDDDNEEFREDKETKQTEKEAQPASVEPALYAYLQNIGKTSLIKANEEIELGRAIASGDDAALSKLVVSNLRLVVSIAKRFRNQGLDMEDMIQEGNLGLIHAAKKFDPTMGNRFSTYATWWIRKR